MRALETTPGGDYSAGMATDTQQVLELADQIGDLLKDHPVVKRYKDAQQSIAADPEAGRLLADFDRQIEALGRQEQAGMPVTDAQQQKLQDLQGRIVSHIKIKNLNLAQVEFVNLLRQISQRYQSKLVDAPPTTAAPAGAPGGPRVIQ